MQETPVRFLGWEDLLEKEYTTHCSILGASLVAQLVKNPPAMRETLGSLPGLGRSPDQGKGYPFQCSGLENSMDSIVHGVTKSWTQLSNFHFHR